MDVRTQATQSQITSQQLNEDPMLRGIKLKAEHTEEGAWNELLP